MMANQRILVADDSEMIREVLTSFLETLNYQVDVAADGQSALDKYTANRYDLIISDLQMPRLEGLSLLKRIKSLEPDAQVILLTGHATLETAVEALRLGAYDYLLKPIEGMEVFGRLVGRALQHGALIKENQRLVEQLRQANARLEAEVATRTIELRAANESLRSLDKLKNDFVSVVSHELRTPMAVILLEAQMLVQKSRSLPPDKLNEIYQTFLTNARRLQIQIENLLDFSLIERGALELECRSCSINQTIRDVVDLYEQRATEKRLRLSTELPVTAQLTVIADAPRLRSALVHLVDNAVKFTPEGGAINISMHGGVTLPGTTTPAVAIAVQDTGIGIPAELQQKLFTAFSQVDMSTTRRYGGMGMGLALAQRIVTAHQGKLTFKSEPNKGSLFVMWVPTGQERR
jgi:signal transduction histidine kinase